MTDTPNLRTTARRSGADRKHPVRAAALVVCSAAFALVAAQAGATTFVAMSEEALARRSDAVVTGEVTRIESVLEPESNGVVTRITLLVDDVLAGQVDGDSIVLRERGGEVAGHAERIFGSADYRVGEKVLVFLRRGPDDELQTTAMALGKYRLLRSRKGRIEARRDALDDVMSFEPTSGRLLRRLRERRVALETVREAVRTANVPRRRWKRPERGPQSPARSVAAPGLPRAEFTFLNTPPARWFNPDDGRSVGYLIDRTGDFTLGLEDTLQAVAAALAAWTTVEGGALRLHNAGLTNPAPFGGCPDDNRIVFNDPFDEVTDPTECSGVLALGGICSSAEERVVNGRTFQRIETGKITVNNGWEQCELWSVCNVSEILAHEIGHTIGLGHSPDDDALMRAVAHLDGRCAHLSEDDVEGLLAAYPAPPTPTDTPTPARSVTRTRTPTRTTASVSPTRTPPATRTPTRQATPPAFTWPPSGRWLSDLLDALQREP